MSNLRFRSLHECEYELNRLGFKNLGWLNSNSIYIPEDGNFVEVLSTNSVYCYCDFEKQMYYFVDGGD